MKSVQVHMSAAQESEAVRWVLYVSMSHGNWRSAQQRLTDEEIKYCFSKSRKKTVRKSLQRLARKRGLALAAEGRDAQ